MSVGGEVIAKLKGQRQFVDVDLPIIEDWEPPTGTVTVSCVLVPIPYPEEV